MFQMVHFKCLSLPFFPRISQNLGFGWHRVTKTARHTCRRQGLAVMVLVGYVLLVALGGLVAGLECKNGALDIRFFFRT